jgi:thiol-disulfide isomerase/thioredoxin
MKKIILILFSALCLSSFTTKSFLVKGSVDNEVLNRKTIFIKERVNGSWELVDSAVIANGRFAFKGMADTAKIVYLGYEYPKTNNVRQAFVLESGEITAEVDTAGFMVIAGTPQNDLLQTYQYIKKVFNKKAEAFYNASKDNVITPEQKLSFATEEENLTRQEAAIDKKFATDNINTLIGTYVFTSSFYNWTTKDKEAVIALFNAETRNVKRVKEIIADVEIEKKVSVGNEYVELKLPGLDGNPIALSDLVGKTDYVLIDFWASWCGPCMRFLPELKAFYAKYQGPKFAILGVSLDKTKESWVGAVASHQMTWKQVSDLKGWKSEGSRAYAVNSIPCTVLIDKRGRIVGRNMSLPEIEKLLIQKAPKK